MRGSNIDKADYFYDEENNPILKIYKFGKVEVYLGDNAYADDNFYEPMKVGTRVVGYFKNGVFVNSSQDHLNTNVVDEAGALNLATPYGERSAPRTNVNEVMDFTLKGFDRDLDAVRMGRRYYDPNSKMFYSADNFFLESPEKILKSPVEGNLYSYGGNDPVGKFDPRGDDAYLFIDKEGAGGKGHSAVMIGNAKSGYSFYSQGASETGSISKLLFTSSIQEGVGKVTGSTPQQALTNMRKADSYQIYDAYIKFNTTEKQDKNMINAAEQRLNSPGGYNLLLNNCSDFCHSILTTGKVGVSDFTITPNEYFKNAADGKNVMKIDYTSGFNNFKD